MFEKLYILYMFSIFLEYLSKSFKCNLFYKEETTTTLHNCYLEKKVYFFYKGDADFHYNESINESVRFNQIFFPFYSFEDNLEDNVECVKSLLVCKIFQNPYLLFKKKKKQSKKKTQSVFLQHKS